LEESCREEFTQVSSAVAPRAVNGDEVGGEFFSSFFIAVWVGAPLIFVRAW
jgi:hypothetical protein